MRLALLRPVALLLVALIAHYSILPVTLRADDPPQAQPSDNVKTDMGDMIWAPNGGYHQGDNVFSYEWDGIKDRYNHATDSPGAMAGALLYFFLLMPLLMPIQLIGAGLCAAFGWFCASDGGSYTGTPGPGPAYCNDSTGAPITDAARAAQCCTGANHDQTPATPPAGCGGVYPPRELEKIAPVIAADNVGAGGEIGTAGTLISDAPAPSPSATAPGAFSPPANTAQASAGGITPSNGGGGPAPGGPGGPRNEAAPHRALGPIGGAGGGNSEFGNLRTAPAGTGAGDGAAATAGSGGADSTYSGGGAGAAGGANGHELALKAESGQISFGSKDGGDADVSAMATDDPSDYFKRIDPRDSIFKIVERRYRSKSIDWAQERLEKFDKVRKVKP